MRSWPIAILLFALSSGAAAEPQTFRSDRAGIGEPRTIEYRPWDDSDPEMQHLARELWGTRGRGCPTMPEKPCEEPRQILRGASDRFARYMIRQIDEAKRDPRHPVVPRSWYSMLAMTESNTALDYLQRAARNPRDRAEKLAAINSLGHLGRTVALETIMEDLEQSEDGEVLGHRLHAVEDTSKHVELPPHVLDRLRAMERRRSQPLGQRRLVHRYLNRMERKGLVPERELSPELRQELGVGPRPAPEAR